MYHQVAYGIGAQADIVEDFVEYMRKWIKNLETKLSIQIGMSYKEYKILTKKEFWLTARESVIYGFVDGYYDFYFIGEKGFFS